MKNSFNTPEDKLDNVMGVIRTFVCSIDPKIHGRNENYLPLTYKDAAILASEVANLRINLARNNIEMNRLVVQRDDLHDKYMGVVNKFNEIDPLWNERPGTTMQNLIAFIDNLMASAGVLRDDKTCLLCEDKWQRIQELDRDIAEAGMRSSNVIQLALSALERVRPQAQGALVIIDIDNAIGACKEFLEEEGQ